MPQIHAVPSVVLTGKRTFLRTEPSVKVALVGGFRPIKCGIATFTTDMHEQLSAWLPGYDIDVYAMVPGAQTAIAPEVSATILQHDRASYRAAAKRMNESAIDVLWIQHEFGIYGGEAGAMVLDLIDGVAAPIIITLHTVLDKPSPAQRAVMDRMKAKASRLVVMSDAGRDILVTTYGVDARCVHVVEHGAPDRPLMSTRQARQALDLAERPTIMTFGLLGPGKGLETAIRAMPKILERHPDVVYRIVGATHPNLLAAEGEAYRDSLKALVAKLGVEQAVEWVERFLDCDELLDQLASCDIYLTPYPNLAQSTSGTLAYAVALGCAVISTPYVHAREILSSGVGVLIPPHDPERIAQSVNELLSDRHKLASLRAKSYARGRQTIWPEFAARCGEIITAVLPKAGASRIATKAGMPSTEAFLGLVDDVGILQHSVGIVPDRHHGYCIDDNARALILVNQVGHDLRHLAPRFAAFLQHGWNADAGRFRNFMGYDRRWLESTGSDDSNGRAIWALGQTAHEARDPRLRAWATALFDATAPHMADIRAPRAMAFFVLGARYMLGSDRNNVAARHVVARCAERFSALPLEGGDDRPDWPWFETVLSYDNARIPEALYALASLTGEARFALAASRKLKWLCALQTSAMGHFRPAGSEGFGLPHEIRPFDQQPLEAWAMIDACGAAMQAEPCETWSTMAFRAYDWYFTGNDRRLALGDLATGSCKDGLMASGVNANTGAESVLAFSLAYQSLTRLAGGQTEDAKPVAHSRSKFIAH